eukprot:jgi/Mesvir1/19720/Mv24056-RA.1
MGSVARLHGCLHITVHEARNLINADVLGKLGSTKVGKLVEKVAGKLIKDVSDPYVTVQVGSIRALRTSTVLNSLNPVWNETFEIDIAADTEWVQFLVKDEDEVGADTLGIVRLSAIHVAAGHVFDGWFDLADSNGVVSGKRGGLRLRLEYIPLRAVGREGDAWTGHLGQAATLEVPESYFPLRHGCVVRLYQDACVPPTTMPHEMDPGGAPSAAPEGTQGCFEDIQAAIIRAQVFVYIAGWSVWPHVRLVRRDYPHPPYKYASGGVAPPAAHHVPAAGTGHHVHDSSLPPTGPAPAAPVPAPPPSPMYPTPPPLDTSYSNNGRMGSVHGSAPGGV